MLIGQTGVKSKHVGPPPKSRTFIIHIAAELVCVVSQSQGKSLFCIHNSVRHFSSSSSKNMVNFMSVHLRVDSLRGWISFPKIMSVLPNFHVTKISTKSYTYQISFIKNVNFSENSVRWRFSTFLIVLRSYIQFCFTKLFCLDIFL